METRTKMKYRGGERRENEGRGNEQGWISELGM